MTLGDIVVVATRGAYTGKPRPALVVQADPYNETHASVTLCPITSDCVDAPLFRVALPDDRTLPPMILMTGAAANRRAQELLREPGVRAFIPKPFTMERFTKTVSQVLET